MELMIPPGLLLLLGALLLPAAYKCHKALYQAVLIALPLAVLGYVYQLHGTAPQMSVSWLGRELSFFQWHDYSLVFATVFLIAITGGGLFGLRQASVAEMVAAYSYGACALGAVFAGDLLTLFLFWEGMALGSSVVIWVSKRAGAYRAAMRYIVVHFFGGVLFMIGLVALLQSGHDLSIGSLAFDTAIFNDMSQLSLQQIAALFILAAVLVNAAAAPFSSWLPDAYPEASAFGTVFLSAFTTKTSVFVLLTMFAGTKLLIPIGLFMVFYGIIYAILENDMRRILAFSVINQVGFMVTGIGIGSTLAMHGVAMHAFCHIIYKALLFMSAGSVLWMTGRSKCNELGGLYHSMPITMVCGVIGALAISAFPLTSGFVSKSLITSAAYDLDAGVIWFLLVAASAGVFLHAGIKFPWFVFFQKDSGLRPADPPWNMRLAMIGFSALCIIPAIPGVAAKTLYVMLPESIEYEAYTTLHVVSQLQLLLFSGFAFFCMLPLLKRTETISLDFDWFYRGLAKKYLFPPVNAVAVYYVRFTRIISQRLLRDGKIFLINTHGPDGVMARNWPIGITIAWAIVILAVYLVLYYSY